MEAEFVQWLRERLPTDARLPLGLGDDAAVLQLDANHGYVVTTDLVCDGVHFDSATIAPELIGRKALAVNLSDLAAMASVPQAAFISLLLPRSADPNLVYRLYDGILEFARAITTLRLRVATPTAGTADWRSTSPWSVPSRPADPCNARVRLTGMRSS